MRDTKQGHSGPALPASGGVEVGSTSSDARLHRFSHEAMATIFEVHADHPDARYAAQAAQAAFDLTDRLERALSRFQPSSDITRINHLGAGERTRVSPATLECLIIARHMFDMTGGAFDVSIGTGLASLDLDAHEWTVSATEPGVRVDLGGIGKGYAVDCMAELLEDWGLERTLVHGGFSSVLVLEPPSGADAWTLTLSDPGDSRRVLASLAVRQTALGASGVRKAGHIVDPRSGEPVRGRRAAWTAVRRPPRGGETSDADAPRAAPAAVADALTTAFMLLPVADIDALCRHTPGLDAWTLEDGPDGGGPLRQAGR
jgi:thiamine biosynthesis lipoprotein